MVTEVMLVTAVVVTENVALGGVVPAGTVTLAGTTTDVLLLVSVTAASLGGIWFKVTVPVEGLPPVTEEGLRLTEDTTTGLTVRVAV